MPWLRKSQSEPLVIAMSGLKLGDRLLVAGSSDVVLVAGLAAKVGLTGRACLVDEGTDAVTRAAAAVEGHGALIESFAAPFTALPFEAGSFDVVVLRSVLSAVPAEARARVSGEMVRVIRPGGRAISIENGKRGGLAGWLGAARGPIDGGTAMEALNAAGLRGVRTHAEREGIVFVEGVKPGASHT